MQFALCWLVALAAAAACATPTHAWRIAVISPRHASHALAATKDVVCGLSGNVCDAYENAGPALLAKLTRGEYDALVGEVCGRVVIWAALGTRKVGGGSVCGNNGIWWSP